LHYEVADQVELFGSTLVLDWNFSFNFDLRTNSHLTPKVRPNACHFKDLCKLGLRPKFLLRTQSDSDLSLLFHPLFITNGSRPSNDVKAQQQIH